MGFGKPSKLLQCATPFGSYHISADARDYLIAISQSGHFHGSTFSFTNSLRDEDQPALFFPMGTSPAMPPPKDQLQATTRMQMPALQESSTSGNLPRPSINGMESPSINGMDGTAKKVNQKVQRGGMDKEPTLVALQDAVCDGDEPKDFSHEPAIFAVLPKPNDPIFTPPASRHNILGFNPLDVHSIPYWNCNHIDPAYESTTTKDLTHFTSLPGNVKSKLARKARGDLDHFVRPINASPILPKFRDMVQNEAAFLPAAMLHSYRAALHVHTMNACNILCAYHKFSKKANLHAWDGAQPSVPKGFGVTGVPYPRAVSAKLSYSVTPRQPGRLHCGCPENIVLMEAILRKVTQATSVHSSTTKTWQHTYMDPRTRLLTMTAFMDWTGLSLSDFFRVAPDGHVWVNPYAELLDRQILVLQQRRQALGTNSPVDPHGNTPVNKSAQWIEQTLAQLDDPSQLHNLYI
ncbi:hypothetical protein AGABI2DRAFT_121700 [Agaricus bisporus var. bisporus H97]|uniref:hypothetical protein n=1 Tax=Agaricus bisporus var. bisporus (strain H97 / ATCC MYA-4626 / FGSC 10389) TaxID=936046 RepID=UPI00029F71AB|nr:hypothetical protein AGABI2DRAFT_121700 [Agaricus bisporus var. bisporus H97]EKV43574.1 hypothetical protein AGABI2DRAFT_121700 [Agaricus bisporus var. bisporus H97]